MAKPRSPEVAIFKAKAEARICSFCLLHEVMLNCRTRACRISPVRMRSTKPTAEVKMAHDPKASLFKIRARSMKTSKPIPEAARLPSSTTLFSLARKFLSFFILVCNRLNDRLQSLGPAGPVVGLGQTHRYTGFMEVMFA